MKIAVVYGNDGSDVRVAKTCATLVQAGHEVHFIGCDRRPDVPKDNQLPGVTRHVVAAPVASQSSNLRLQWAFTKHAVATLCRLRPEAVHAVNEDNVLRLGWLKGGAFRYLVCDVFDSHLDKQSHRSWPIRALVNVLVQGTRWWSDRLIATDDVRFDTFGWAKSKTMVIGNYPPDPGPNLAIRYPVGPPKIFASGTLSHLRGTEQMLRAAELVPGLKIIAAGWASDEYSQREFLGHPSVEFLGHITPAQSLEVAAECDALMAIYEPSTRNHILASPNKIYDALSVGRPVVINSEALVSQWVTRHEVGFACPYTDVNSLATWLNEAVNRRQQLPDYAVRARQLFLSGYSWEAMEERLAHLYGSLAGGAKKLAFPAPTDSVQSTAEHRKAA